jgi:hypothetical protein
MPFYERADLDNPKLHIAYAAHRACFRAALPLLEFQFIGPLRRVTPSFSCLAWIHLAFLEEPMSNFV